MADNEMYMTAAAAATVLSSCMLMFARKSVVATHKRIVAGNSALNNYISSGLQAKLDRYTPTWWTNGHIQVFLTFLVPQSRIKYKRDVLVLRDGGHASLDWALESSGPVSKTGKPLQHDSPIAIITHGLTGCSASMRSLCAEALKNGYRPVVFNKRGHGGLDLATPKLQEFGCVQDYKEAITHVERAFPNSKLYGIGSSAGAGLLCSYLGEVGNDSRLDAGVLISPGYNAFELFCEGRINRVYDFLMTFTLKKFLIRHQHSLQHVVDIPKALTATSIREFDQQVYMKMHGYKDLESYWLQNDPMRDIDNIQRPLLCINALDDPVCTKETIRYDKFEDSPLTMLVETQEGSHCAFYEGSVFLKSWANEASMLYLDQVREYQLDSIQSKLETEGHSGSSNVSAA
jgi:predicted alpha/beta-fold hydrolase|uniref:AB hydrolase-1 domain-containing protein n=1 Tax=Globisporangium ultimum (strain ATCC 200006 / CBS 805.95 / DAOM BR144) TaxID=431595 RepID=K3WWC0_GLOUD